MLLPFCWEMGFSVQSQSTRITVGVPAQEGYGLGGGEQQKLPNLLQVSQYS